MYQYNIKKLDHITKNIWLGDSMDANDQKLLQEYKITHILITGGELKANFPKAFNYKKLQIENYNWCQNVSDLFDSAVEFMKQGNCFVHCLAGVHRAPTFVLAYLINAEQMSFEDAFKLVKKQRPRIEPPKMFIDLLINYDKKCQNERNQQAQTNNQQQNV